MSTSPSLDKKTFQQEFVAGGFYSAALAAVRASLPQYIDDISRDDPEVYAKMLRDAQVGPTFETRRLAVLAEGYRVVPAYDQPGPDSDDTEAQAKFERADEMAKFVERAIDACSQDLTDVCHELLDALAFGNRVAEIVLKPGKGADIGKYVLGSIKVKPPKNTAFLINEFSDIAGMRVTLPSGGMVDVDRRKFIIFQNCPKGSCPLGISELRPVYLSWFLKTQVLPDFFKFLKGFASPSIVAKTPKELSTAVVPLFDSNGQMVEDDNGSVLVSPEYALMQQILAWANGYARGVLKLTWFSQLGTARRSLMPAISLIAKLPQQYLELTVTQWRRNTIASQLRGLVKMLSG